MKACLLLRIKNLNREKWTLDSTTERLERESRETEKIMSLHISLNSRPNTRSVPHSIRIAQGKMNAVILLQASTASISERTHIILFNNVIASNTYLEWAKRHLKHETVFPSPASVQGGLTHEWLLVIEGDRAPVLWSISKMNRNASLQCALHWSRDLRELQKMLLWDRIKWEVKRKEEARSC